MAANTRLKTFSRFFEESDFSGESDLYGDDQDVDFDHVT